MVIARWFILSLLTIGVLSISWTGSPYQFVKINSDTQQNLDEMRILSIIHDPILIGSDADFAAQAGIEGWSGDGSESTPYVIQQLDISDDEDCIHIENTTSYFIISGCELTSPLYRNGYGIFLKNATNGVISNCVVHLKSIGIYIDYNSDYTGISFNAIYDNYDAIKIFHAKYCQVIWNAITLNGKGIDIYSDDCFIGYNSIAHCSGAYGYGIDAYASDRLQVIHNTFYNNSLYDFNADISAYMTVAHNVFDDGIWFSDVRDLSDVIITFENNTLDGREIGYFLNRNNQQININQYSEVIVVNCTNLVLHSGDIYGAYFGYSYKCVLERSYVHGSPYIGVAIEESQKCNVTSNVIYENHLIGIHLEYSHNCTISLNSVFHNNPEEKSDCGGISIDHYSTYNIVFANAIGWNFGNAVDRGRGGDIRNNNTWDDGVSIGNWWDDYSGHGQYLIPGNEGSVDRYPSKLNDIVQTIFTEPLTPGDGNGGDSPDFVLLVTVVGAGLVVIIVVILLVTRKRV